MRIDLPMLVTPFVEHKGPVIYSADEEEKTLNEIINEQINECKVTESKKTSMMIVNVQLCWSAQNENPAKR